VAAHWVDLKLGDDSTGDGTYALPYRTINKAISIASTLDEIKVYETDANTTVMGDVTFTNDSATLNTASDLTGSLSVGDWMGKVNAAGNGAEEHYYRINAITATTITLETRYYGESELVSSVTKLYIETNNETDHVIDYDRNITLTISGGWDSETTQDGETWVTNNSARTTSTYYSYYAQYSGGTVQKMNFAEIYSITSSSGGKTTFEDCSFHVYNVFGITNGGNLKTYTRCCGSTRHTSYCIYNGDQIITDCYFFGNRGSSYLVHGGSNRPMDFIRTKIYGFQYYMTSLTYSYRMTWEDCEIRYCTTGILNPASNTVVSGISFHNCTTGISAGTSSHGVLVQNCHFEDCTYGWTSDYSNNSYFHNCSFVNCSYGIRSHPAHASPSFTISNCSFTTPTSYGIYFGIGQAGNSSITDCSIDVASQSKMIYNPNTRINGLTPRMTLHGTNADNYYPAGSYYGYYSILIDDEASGYPILKVFNKTTWNYYTLGGKVFSTYVKAGNGKKITFKYKHDTGWSGDIKFKARVNNVEVKEFTDDEITTITSTWITKTITILDEEILHDGELAIHILPNGNTSPWRIQFTNVEDV